MKMKARPQLFIDTSPLQEDDPQALKIFGETDKYSITPTTFKSRAFESKVNIDLKEKILTIKHKLQETQEALNTKISKIIQPLEEDVAAKFITQAQKQELLGKESLYLLYKNRESELNQYQDKIEIITPLEYPDLSIFSDIYSNNSGNTVFRYGLNSSVLVDTVKSYNTALQQKVSALSQKSGKSNKPELPKTILHPLEIITTIKAISFMVEEKKTALIDIFARDDKEQIQFDIKTKLPETHTIVLYKNNDNNIIVIDPSNSTFSKYLASEMSNLLVSGKLMDQTLRVPTNEIKIYTPSKNIGPNPDQYRDCIDIAAKIAFGLNKNADPIDISKIIELPTIKEITNQKLINEAFITDYGAARLRQASNDKIRNVTDKIMNKLYQQRKSVAQYKDSEELTSKLIENDIDSFKKPYESDSYKKGLNNLITTFCDNVSIIDNYIKQDITLLGQEIDIIDEQL